MTGTDNKPKDAVGKLYKEIMDVVDRKKLENDVALHVLLENENKFKEAYAGMSDETRKKIIKAVQAVIPPDTLGGISGYFGNETNSSKKTKISAAAKLADAEIAEKAKAAEQSRPRGKSLDSVDSNATTEPGTPHFSRSSSVDMGNDELAAAEEALFPNRSADFSEEQMASIDSSLTNSTTPPFAEVNEHAFDNLTYPKGGFDAFEPTAEEKAAALVQRVFRGKKGRDTAAGMKKAKLDFASVVEQEGARTAEKIKAFEALVEQGIKGNGLKAALEGVTLPPKGISLLEKLYKDREEVLGPIYEKALRQDIENDTITPGKLKKYSKIISDLNKLRIEGEPVIAFAAVTAIDNNKPHMIGQLANAGLDVNAKMSKVSNDKTILEYLSPTKLSTKEGANVANALLFCGAIPTKEMVAKCEGNPDLQKRVQYLSNTTAENKNEGAKIANATFEAGKKTYFASVAAHNKTNQSVEATHKTVRGTKDTGKAVVSGASSAAKFAKDVVVATPGALYAGGKGLVKGISGVAISTAGVALGTVATIAVGVPVGAMWLGARGAMATVRLIEDAAKSSLRGTKEALSPTINAFNNDLKTVKYYEQVILATDPLAKKQLEAFDQKIDSLASAIKSGDKEGVQTALEGIKIIAGGMQANELSESGLLPEQREKLAELASGLIKSADAAKATYDQIHHRNIDKDGLTSQIRSSHADSLFNNTVGAVYNITVKPALGIIKFGTGMTLSALPLPNKQAAVNASAFALLPHPLQMHKAKNKDNKKEVKKDSIKL